MTETYAGNRLVHDADAHLSEHDGFYEPYADPAIRPRLAALDGGSGGRDVSRAVERIRLAHRSENRMAALAGNPGEVLMYKDLAALGAFDPQDRVEVLDRLGFRSQLMFTTTYLGVLTDLDRGDDLELSIGAGEPTTER
ncbi:MAG: hypothetical protein R2705_01090 [Ilumatobacteraceae bacterium]